MVVGNHSAFGRDAAVAAGIGALLATLYAVFIQFNLSYDGAFLAYEEIQPVQHYLPPHILFGPWLRFILFIGAEWGVSPRIAGSLQSGVMMACAMALFFAALRRCGVSWKWAAAFALLMGCNAPMLENATSVEVYGLTMFAVMLSLHAFMSEARSPSVHGAALMMAANVFIVMVQAGFGFWVLSVYLALAIHGWHGRRWRRPLIAIIVSRLAQGLAVLLALLGTIWLANAMGYSPSKEYDAMFGRFFVAQSLWSHLVNSILAPLDQFQANAGLAIVPAALGFRSERRRLSALALLAIISSILFLGFFHAWTLDWGKFYMPVMALWGIFAALGCEAVFESGDRRAQWALGLMAVCAVALFMLPFQDTRIFSWIDGVRHRGWLGVLFYVFLAAQWILASRFNRGSGPRQGRYAGTAWVMAALALMLFCYLPHQVRLLKPNSFQDYVLTVQKLMEGRDLSRQRMITCFQADRLELDTGIESCPSKWLGMKAGELIHEQNRIDEWIRGTARRQNPLQVWIDSAAMPEARLFWNRGILKSIPMETLSFRPVTIDSPTSHTFYEINLKQREKNA